jgi:hypothetical protein
MNAKREMITPLDKEALVLLPGLRYAQALIEIAMQTCRHSASRPAIEKAANRLPVKKPS